MGIGMGGAALLGTAIPGVAGAIAAEPQRQQDQANAMIPGTDKMIQNDPTMQSWQDPNHPVWNVLNNVTGALPTTQSASALPKGFENGGPVTDHNGNPIVKSTGMDLARQAVKEIGGALFGSGAGARAASASGAAVNGAQQKAEGYQNGGVVRQNFGKDVIQPAFTKGPALPVGPNNTIVNQPSPRMGMLSMENGGPVPTYDPTARSTGLGQGITPAGTEGQILTMDAGGVVPQGMIQQPGITGVPMNGGAAAFVQGMQAGQNLGNNLYQAFAEGNNKKAFGDYADQVSQADVNNTGQDNSQQGILSQAKDSVEGFFHHLFNKTLNDDHKPNDSAGVSAPGGAGNASSGPALPTPAGGSPVGDSLPAAGASAGTSPALPSAPGGSPPVGSAPAAAPSGPSPIPSAGQSGGGPAQPAQPVPGKPAPVAQNVDGSDPNAQPDPNMLPEVQVTAAKTIAAQDPNAQAGKPSTDSRADQAHSLTPEYWHQLEVKKWQAVKAAQAAGEDPAKVYESLTAMQNAHFQGQILKQASTAYQAFQNNDMPAVAQAIKNMNYYLPNGQDIDIKKATAADVAADPTGNTKIGDVMHANPYYKMYGHDGEPAYTRIDLPYLQQLGTAALDPRNVQEAQLKAYSAQAEARANSIKAEGELKTGQGREFTGLAAVKNANSKEAMLDVDARLKRADAGLKTAQANWYDQRGPGGNGGQPKISMSTVATLQKQAYDMTNSLVQGQPTTAPVMVPVKDANGQPVMGPDGKPQMEPNLSPGAGKQLPDPSRVPVFMKNPDGRPFSPEQQHNTAVVAGQIAAANAGMPGMDVARSVELAARITQQETKLTSHTDPKTGKPMKDFVYDPKNGTAHVWMGNGYENVYLRPNVADESGGANDQPPSGGSTPGETEGGSAGPDAFQ